jgi:hypothetical protein
MDTKVAPVLWRASLNYFPGSATGQPATLELPIHDGRAASLPGWEECGFELLPHPSAVTEWSDDESIKRIHYPEIVALAERLSGCDHALLSSHIKRGPEQAKQHHDLAPITLVHSDFADTYGRQIRERWRNPNEEEAAALDAAGISASAAADARRIVILQFWRNIGAPKMDMPLAFCDARTVPRPQIRPFPVTNYAGGGFDFDALGFAAPDRLDDHAWYAFDSMQVDEVVAFRTYDTDRVDDGRPYWTPHSAVRDPSVPLGRPSRSSIELRATCVFL